MEKIVEKEADADLFIFIGDYWDSFDISFSLQKSNFIEIIDFKTENPDKVKLLFGNHDFHYIPGNQYQYSGHQHWHQTDIGEMISQSIHADLVQMCFIKDGYLFSHAGVTNTWALDILGNDDFNLESSQVLEQAINDMFKYQPKVFEFRIGENMDEYGNDITQTQIWVRPESLSKDKLDSFTMVVGHTQGPIDIGFQYNNIIMIDALGQKIPKYLVIEDDIPRAEYI